MLKVEPFIWICTLLKLRVGGNPSDAGNKCQLKWSHISEKSALHCSIGFQLSRHLDEVECLPGINRGECIKIQKSKKLTTVPIVLVLTCVCTRAFFLSGKMEACVAASCVVDGMCDGDS